MKNENDLTKLLETVLAEFGMYKMHNPYGHGHIFLNNRTLNFYVKADINDEKYYLVLKQKSEYDLFIGDSVHVDITEVNDNNSMRNAVFHAMLLIIYHNT